MNVRDEYITRMIRIYGYENPLVIEFAQLCEDMSDTESTDEVLRQMVEAHERCPLYKEP